MPSLWAAWATVQAKMQYVAAAGTGVMTFGMMYPELWGITRYRKMMQMYRDDVPEPVDEDTKRMGQQVFDKVLWDAKSEASVEFFTAYGQDLVRRGSTFSRYGALVGVPIHFRYRSVEDVEKESFTLNNAAIDFSSAAGKQLLASLVLTEKARQFAIAREIFSLRTFKMHVNVVLACGSFILAYWMGAAANLTYGLSRRLPIGSRAIVYSFFGGVGATLYCLGYDKYSWYRDRKVDMQAAELGLDYAEGGVEFYSSLLQRNTALRALLGPEGNKRYTAYGNDVHFWRSPTVPLTSRRDALMEMVKSMQDSAATQEPSETADPA